MAVGLAVGGGAGPGCAGHGASLTGRRRGGALALLLAPGLLVAALAAGCGDRPAGGVASPVMAAIRSRGQLICGVEGTMPGFSRLDGTGRELGLDADLCRAMAATVLGDGERVQFRHLSAAERFTALASGEVDLLARNTTLTLSRDASGGNALSFGPIVYYDSQGFLVPRDGGPRRAADLRERSICVVSGTTTELNLADWMRQQGIPYAPLKFQTHDQSFAAYLQGRCAAVTSGLALLAARRSSFPDPTAHRLLDVAISKEPFAPATRQGDPVWTDALRWTVYALMEAEELGITQANLAATLRAARADQGRAELRRFLGVEGDLGPKLGLPADFTVRAVAAVGNYGELFERHLGPRSPLGLERGLQRLARDGGLIVAPPFR